LSPHAVRQRLRRHSCDIKSARYEGANFMKRKLQCTYLTELDLTPAREHKASSLRRKTIVRREKRGKKMAAMKGM
jgi:hypothetical protein